MGEKNPPKAFFVFFSATGVEGSDLTSGSFSLLFFVALGFGEKKFETGFFSFFGLSLDSFLGLFGSFLGLSFGGLLTTLIGQ